MAKNRYVDTKFWDDSFIITLSPTEKLLFLYLITNPLTNSAGIYEISLRRINFDTGLTHPLIEKALAHFEKSKKVFYRKNYIIIINFIRNQKLNRNMQIGILSILNNLPEIVRPYIFKELPKDLKGLPNALKHIFQPLLSLSYSLDLNLGLDYKEKSEKEKADMIKIKNLLENKSPEFLETFNDFKKMRSEIKSILTLNAKKLILMELNKLSNKDKKQIEILQQSIMNNWKGVFPVKGNSEKPQRVMPTVYNNPFLKGTEIYTLFINGSKNKFIIGAIKKTGYDKNKLETLNPKMLREIENEYIKLINQADM